MRGFEEVAGEHRDGADTTGGEAVAQRSDPVLEAAVLHHGVGTPSLLGGADERLRVLERRRDRLLAEDVASEAEGRLDDRPVRFRRRQVDDDVGRGRLDCRLQRAEDRRGHAVALGRRARDLGVDVDQCDHVHVEPVAQDREPEPRDRPHADDGNSERRHARSSNQPLGDSTHVEVSTGDGCSTRAQSTAFAIDPPHVGVVVDREVLVARAEEEDPSLPAQEAAAAAEHLAARERADEHELVREAGCRRTRRTSPGARSRTPAARPARPGAPGSPSRRARGRPPRATGGCSSSPSGA